MEKALDYQMEKIRMENPEMTQEQIDGARDMSQMFSKPWITFIFIVVNNLFFGFLISLIGGLIIKKSKPE